MYLYIFRIFCRLQLKKVTRRRILNQSMITNSVILGVSVKSEFSNIVFSIS